MSSKINAVVLGASGYVGGELLRLIAAHPALQFAAAVSESRNGDPIASTFANLLNTYGDTCFVGYDGWLDAIDEG